MYMMVSWTLRGFVCVQVGWFVWRGMNVPEHAMYCDSRRFTPGFGLVEYIILKNVCLLWAVTVLRSGFFRLLFLRVDCECNWPSFLATVFYQAYAFNGDVNQWDVANVNTMYQSKSIRILENDLA